MQMTPCEEPPPDNNDDVIVEVVILDGLAISEDGLGAYLGGGKKTVEIRSDGDFLFRPAAGRTGRTILADFSKVIGTNPVGEDGKVQCYPFSNQEGFRVPAPFFLPQLENFPLTTGMGDNISPTFRWTVTDIERSPGNPSVILITGNHECVACVGGTVGCSTSSPTYIGTFITTDSANKEHFGIALEAVINANLGGRDVPAVLPSTTDKAFIDAPGGHFHGNGKINFKKGTLDFVSYGLVESS